MCRVNKESAPSLTRSLFVFNSDLILTYPDSAGPLPVRVRRMVPVGRLARNARAELRLVRAAAMRRERRCIAILAAMRRPAYKRKRERACAHPAGPRLALAAVELLDGRGCPTGRRGRGRAAQRAGGGSVSGALPMVEKPTSRRIRSKNIGRPKNTSGLYGVVPSVVPYAWYGWSLWDYFWVNFGPI
jgi:hypothetical protein